MNHEAARPEYNIEVSGSAWDNPKLRHYRVQSIRQQKKMTRFSIDPTVRVLVQRPHVHVVLFVIFHIAHFHCTYSVSMNRPSYFVLVFLGDSNRFYRLKLKFVSVSVPARRTAGPGTASSRCRRSVSPGRACRPAAATGAGRRGRRCRTVPPPSTRVGGTPAPCTGAASGRGSERRRGRRCICISKVGFVQNTWKRY